MKADPTLSNTEPMRFNNQGTLFALTPDEADYLLAQLEAKNPGLSDILNPPAVAAGSNGATPPAANPILGLDTDEINQLTFLTFHPSYTYEDFIEGFKPVPSAATGGGLNLRLEDGVFKRICRQAQANPGKRYLVLIDEINRANLAKVFGELITLLEKDKRGKFKVVLPQSRETFTIPENVYLLGTMNTADKSIKLLDAALRRRFAFKELMPDADLLTGGKIGDLLLDVFLEELNRRIATREGREKQIGHSFLLEDGKAVDEPEEFARRFRQEILPLLQEYCYDDYADLAYYLGDKLVDKQAQTLDFDILNDPDKLVEALAFSFKGTSPT
jgi:5-methylcytosine-specific restriction protein B